MAVKSRAPLLRPFLLFRLLWEICVFMDITVFGPLWFLVATYLEIPPDIVAIKEFGIFGH